MKTRNLLHVREARILPKTLSIGELHALLSHEEVLAVQFFPKGEIITLNTQLEWAKEWFPNQAIFLAVIL